MLDAVIVGAGFAGLAAAHRLMQAGKGKLAVLEARDRVGGRTMPGDLAGLRIDLGGMWLGPSQTRLAELAGQYQVRTYPTFLDGRAVYRVLGKQHCGRREDAGGLFGPLDVLDEALCRRKLARLSAPLDCERPWDHPDAARLDATTLEQWLLDNLRSARLRQFYRLACFSLFCAEARQVSMLFFLHYVKAGDGMGVMLSQGEGGAQNLLFHGGVHQIAQKMGEELGERLRLGEAVAAVSWEEGGVEATTADGAAYRARRVILAVPPTLVPDIDFAPALPAPKAALHRRLAMGSAIKYWVAYESPFWREQGFNGLVARDDLPCSPCIDVTPPDQPKGVIAGFFDGDHAIDHSDAGQEARRELVLGMLAEHFGPQARAPLQYLDHDWSRERWSGGCYGAYAAPGIYASYGAWLRRPIGPLHWAGTETSPRWTGYIDGAVRSGERAADEVLAG